MSDPKVPEPEITYPCQWEFKVIGSDQDSLSKAVANCLQDCVRGRQYTLGLARTSAGGKYVSLNLDLRVDSEEERNTLFAALCACPEVKMLI